MPDANSLAGQRDAVALGHQPVPRGLGRSGARQLRRSNFEGDPRRGSYRYRFGGMQDKSLASTPEVA
jgi:hypothetical protein